MLEAVDLVYHLPVQANNGPEIRGCLLCTIQVVSRVLSMAGWACQKAEMNGTERSERGTRNERGRRRVNGMRGNGIESNTSWSGIASKNAII